MTRRRRLILSVLAIAAVGAVGAVTLQAGEPGVNATVFPQPHTTPATHGDHQCPLISPASSPHSPP